MKKVLEYNCFKNFRYNLPTSIETIIKVEEQLKKSLPIEYKEFLLEHNGGEGPIGINSYLVLWPVDDLIMLNIEYAVNEFTPGLLYFGSDGGNTAYAFDFRNEYKKIVEFPFDSINIDDAWECGSTFNDFIVKLCSK